MEYTLGVYETQELFYLHGVYDCGKVPYMKQTKKPPADLRLQLRVSKPHRQALERLAEKHEKSMAQVIWDTMENKAKREGCWPK